jgi:GNAT superfamily N-acetyltransferase
VPKLATTDAEIESCFDVMAELRPHLSRVTFRETVRQMESQGYKLVYIAVENEVVAAAGYRIYTNLFMGLHCYVDDLVTATIHRSKGYGEQMIKWLRNEAVQAGCNHFHLDSGTHRDQAHKFYFAQGLHIASYHFSEELK